MKHWRTIFAAALAAFSLAGCGGNDAPTAQELMEGAASAHMSGYVDMGLELIAESLGEGQEGTMSFTAGIEGSGDVLHVYDGAMSLSAGGSALAFELESWADQGKGISYTDMSVQGESSGWVKAGMDGAAGIGAMADTGWLMDAPGGYELLEHKAGEDWAVAFTILSDNVPGALDGSGDLEVTARFDEESHDLKSVEARCDDEGVSVTLKVTVRSREGGELAIPQEVMDSAVDVGLLSEYDGDEGAYIVDAGDGTDKAAQAAQEILDTGLARGPIQVQHFEDGDCVYWESEHEGWSIGAEVAFLFDDSPEAVKTAFQNDAAFLAEYMANGGELYAGGMEAGEVAYTRHISGIHELDYASYDAEKGCTVIVDVCCYDDGTDDAALWDALQAFLGAHGL